MKAKKPTKANKVRRTHKERAAEAQRLMDSMSANTEPVTITETGEVQDGAASELAEEGYLATDEQDSFFEEYGACPHCVDAGILHNDVRLWVARELWSLCEEHHVKWLSTLTGATTGISEEGKWGANEARLQDYRTVAAARPSPTYPAERYEEQKASYNRLWTILKSTHTDRALLEWILETHTDLPQDLSWLIRRQLAD